MATATAERPIFEEPLPPGPPNGFPHSATTTRPSTGHHDFPNPASPIVIRDFLGTKLKYLGSSLRDTNDALALLNACLHLERFERAASVLRRFSQGVQHRGPELLDAHVRYLGKLVDYAVRKRSETHLRSAQQWFEVEIKGRGVEPNATIYALMLKASLNFLQGPKLARTVRRYMDMAICAGRDLEVLHSPVLSEADLFLVTKLCPAEFFLAEEQESSEGKEELPETKRQSSISPLAPESNQAEKLHEAVVAELRPTKQQGLGLDSLKKSLAALSSANSVPCPDGLEGTKEERDRIYATMRQKKLEFDAVEAAIGRWRQESESLESMGISPVMNTRYIGALMWQWHLSTKEVLQQELKKLDEIELDTASLTDRNLGHCAPFLHLVPIDSLAGIAILGAMNCLRRKTWALGMQLTTMVLQIGESVHQECHAQQARKHLSKAQGQGKRDSKTLRLLRRRHRANDSKKLMPQAGDHQSQPSSETMPRWSKSIQVQIGSILLSAVLQSAKMLVPRKHAETGEEAMQVVSAFTHTIRIENGKKVGYVTANAALVEACAKQPLTQLLVKHLPMVVEPRPWTSFDSGAYLTYPVNIMRTKGLELQRHYVVAAQRKGDLDQMFKALNCLSRTPWRVNQFVLEVMAEAWNTGDAIADIPAEQLEQPDPEPEPDSSATPEERQKWRQAVREAKDKRSALHSQRCFENMKLEIARSFVNDTFYFPHNMDFRGRAYPVSPLFNHIGADSSRGLLIFARGKPLGKTGLYWLKIHLANVYGYDKASFEEREKFAMDHLEDISDSAVNPLNGRRWWLTAEDPWQCLATCKELRNALDSPDPTQFVSHLPVHQDGTCNGLQHYAALGGDVMGAQQVNLEPGSRPADIYSAVAQMVEDAAARDAAAGNELAAFLVGKIRRKVVKQTVMTSVYGVTRFGGHRQVSKQVDELIPVDERFSPSQLAKYINHQIFNSLSSMFLAAHHIQHWFIECANRICRAVSPEHLERIELSREGGDYRDVSTIAPSRPSAKMEAAHQLGFLEPVVWTTPLKLPVVQPYRTRSMYKIHTGLQHVSLHEHQSSAPVDRRKQMAAFPPNFVHSLDATHMYLTAIKCNEMGLTFASVHDSFWTHAADVDTMNGVVRDTFITVHQDAVLVRLAEEFRARYKDCLFLMTVPPSNKAAQSIREFRHKAMTEWRKASRAGANGLCKPRDRNQYQSYVVHELLLERQRQLLLQSDDVEERETGRQMVTPASLYEEANNASSSLSETAPEPTAVAEELHSSLSPPTSSDLADGIASLESNLLDTEVAEVDVEGDDAASAVWVSDKDFDPDDAAAKAEKKKGKKKKKKHQPASEIGEEEERQKEATGKATDKVQAKGSRKKANVNKPLKIWHPLFFPPVPPKGDFDVTRLRRSQYFFC